MSTQNTKIAVSKVEWGVKLPCESSKVGNGYAANGPVITYKLPPEEVERIFARAKKPEGKPPIRWRNPHQKKEDNEMQTINETAETVNENSVPCNETTDPCSNSTDLRKAEQESTQEHNFEVVPDKPKTRMEIAREKLSVDTYKKLSKTMSDKQIRKTFDIAIDVLIALKREWGIEIKPIMPSKTLAEPAPAPIEPTGEGEIPDDTFPPLPPADDTEKTCKPIAGGVFPGELTPIGDMEETCEPAQPEVEYHLELSLNDAIKRREELAAEVKCADMLLDPDGDYYVSVTLTDGIKLLLDGHRCLCAQQLKRIQDAKDFTVFLYALELYRYFEGGKSNASIVKG